MTTGSTSPYDADGIRTSKTTGAGAISYLVDKNLPFAQVLVETTGATVVSYVHGDDLISMKRPTGTSYYHYDGQMSTRQLTDSAQVATDTYAYDAFGIELNRAGATINDYRYTGEQYDTDIGSYYLRARYYNQLIGRFTTMDAFPGSLFDPLSLHRYQYAHVNPVDNLDPSGNFTLLGVQIAVSIQSILVSIAWGAIFGAVFGAADAFFGGRSVLEGAIQGAVIGAAVAPIAAIAVQVMILKHILVALGLAVSIAGVTQALLDEDYDLAVFRGVVALAGIVMLAAVNKASSGTQLKVPAGRLTAAGSQRWVSTAGLKYGPDFRFGNRVLHVMNHASNDPSRNVPHGVFTVGRGNILALLDDAYLRINANRTAYWNSNTGAFEVNMGQVIGYEGGGMGSGQSTTWLRLVVNGLNGDEVMTAYPFVK